MVNVIFLEDGTGLLVEFTAMQEVERKIMKKRKEKEKTKKRVRKRKRERQGERERGRDGKI